MNWIDVVSSLLAFVIFLLFLTTLLYFVQYQMQKKHRLKSQFVHPLEGRFLLRYVPLELKAKYEKEILEQKSVIDRKSRRWWFQGTAILFFLLIGPRAPAEQPLVSTSVEFDSTSDELKKTSFLAGYRNHRRDLLWPYAGETAQAVDWGVTAEHHKGEMADSSKFSGTKIGVFVGHKYSHRAYFDAAVFAHQLESVRNSVDTARLTGQTTIVLNPVDPLWISFLGRNDFVYQEMFLPAGITRGLTASTARIDFVYRLQEKWRALGKTSQKWFSDGNRREDHELALMYGIAPTTPWIWAGLGASYLGYQTSQPGLWTPHDFFAYGPKIDVAVPMAGGFTAVTELNYNISREESQSDSHGYSAAIGVKSGDRNDLQVVALFRRIETDLRKEGWSSRGGTLLVTYSF